MLFFLLVSFILQGRREGNRKKEGREGKRERRRDTQRGNVGKIECLHRIIGMTEPNTVPISEGKLKMKKKSLVSGWLSVEVMGR